MQLLLSALLAGAALAAALAPVQGKTALVLGSGGLVGRGLVHRLRERGWAVQEVVNRTHVDLRVAGALDAFQPAEIDVVYFLACEVGGSKFLYGDVEDAQVQVLRHNLQMYEVVWPWVAAHQLRTVFVSSQLQEEATPYGAVKRLGEAWAAQLPHARTVRLWNVYGPEREGVKSHVANDWVLACLRRGHVEALTDGLEARQFLHTLDAGDAFVDMAEEWATLPQVTDLTSGQWTRLTDLARVIDSAMQAVGAGLCDFHFPSVAAQGNVWMRDPHMASEFHLEVAGVRAAAAAALDVSPSAITEDGVQRLVEAGTTQLLGRQTLEAGVLHMVQQLQAEEAARAPVAAPAEEEL